MQPIAQFLRASARLLGGAMQRGGRALTLVPTYLAGLLWLLSQKFEELAREGYGRNAAVYAVMRVLCTAVAEPPLVPYRVGKDGSVGKPLPWTDSLYALIRRPNELMTEPQMWTMITLHTSIVGRSVWYKERDRGGRPIALWPLRPDRVGPIYSTDGTAGQQVISGWSYQVPGTVEYVPIPRADTVFFVHPDPAGESGGLVEGLGPLQALAAEVGADNQATQFVGSLLANYAVPGVVLGVKTPLRDADDAKIIKAGFIRDFGGNRRGAPAVIDADTTVTQLGFNLKDLEFEGVRGTTESRISAAFGVPAILVGFKTGLTSGIRATISEQREYFAETTCSGHWRILGAAFTEQVAPDFDAAVVCHFDMTKVKALQQQGKYEVEKIATGFAQGAVRFDEYRVKVLQLPPVGGDLGDAFLIPTTSATQPGDGSLPAPQPDTSGGADDSADPDSATGDSEDDAGSGVKAVLRPLPGGRFATYRPATRKAQPAREGATPAHLAAVRANADRRLQTAMDHHSGPLYEYLRGLGAAMAERVRRTATVKAITMPDTGVPPEQTAKLRALIVAVWQDAMQAAYADTADLLGTAVSFDLANPRIADVLGQLARGRYEDGWDKVDETTRDVVRQQVDAATRAGWGVEQLADALQASSAFRATRALAIARTESGLAYNLATTLAYHDSGMVARVEVLDGLHDGPCAAANGAVWTLEEAQANPLQHTNCVRAFAPVVTPAAGRAAA